jgi:putrescine transport system permease protein
LIRGHHWIRLFFYMGYVFLYLPIILTILYSFNHSQTIAWTTFSLRWYRVLFKNQALWQSAMVSLKIALISATIAVILGTVCAHLWTKEQHNHNALGLLAMVPLVVPELITGLSILLLFVWSENTFGWPPRGIWTVITAHTTLGAAYVTAIVRSRLLNLDPALSEAALDLGALPSKVFFLIKLPIIIPSIIASWLIAFIISFDDVVLASFTSGPGITTLPLRIFSSIKVGYTPQINALAACITGMISILIMSAGYALHKKESQ